MADDTLSPSMVRLKYSRGMTVNLGNFESLRIDIGIEMECAQSEVPATYDRMRQWVDRNLDAQLRKGESNG